MFDVAVYLLAKKCSTVFSVSLCDASFSQYVKSVSLMMSLTSDSGGGLDPLCDRGA